MFQVGHRGVPSGVLIDHDDEQATITSTLLFLLCQQMPTLRIFWYGTTPPPVTVTQLYPVQVLYRGTTDRPSSPPGTPMCIVMDGYFDVGDHLVIRYAQRDAYIVYRARVHTTSQLKNMKRLCIKESLFYHPLSDILDTLTDQGKRITFPNETNHPEKMERVYLTMSREEKRLWSDMIRIYQRCHLSPSSMARISSSDVFIANMLMTSLLSTITKYRQDKSIVVVIVPGPPINENLTWERCYRESTHQCPTIAVDMVQYQTSTNPLLQDWVRTHNRGIPFPIYHTEQLRQSCPSTVYEWSTRKYQFDHASSAIIRRNVEYGNKMTRVALHQRKAGIYVVEERIAKQHCEILQGLDIIELVPFYRTSDPGLYCTQVIPRTRYSYKEVMCNLPPTTDQRVFTDILFDLQLKDIIAVWWEHIGGWDGMVHYMVADGNAMTTMGHLIPPFNVVTRHHHVDNEWVTTIQRYLDAVRHVDVKSSADFLLRNPHVRSIVQPRFASKHMKSIRMGKIGAKCYLMVMQWIRKMDRVRVTSIPPLIPIRWTPSNQHYFPISIREFHHVTRHDLPDDLLRMVLTYVWDARPMYHMMLQEIGFLSFSSLSSDRKVSYSTTSISTYLSIVQMLDPDEVNIFHGVVMQEIKLV